MARWPSSLRSRLTMWYAVLLGLPLIAFALICYVAFARALLSRTDHFINDALTAFSRELVAERRATLSASDAIRRTVEEVRFRDLHIAILDSAGQVVAMTPVVEADRSEPTGRSVDGGTQLVAAMRTRSAHESGAMTIPGEREPYRVVTRPLVIAGEHFNLRGVYALRDMDEVLDRIRRMFLVVIPVLILCAAASGSFLAKRSLAPVAAMATQATEISASNLDARLPVAGGDELVRLARVINDLLDRLELAFAQQRRFVADASHELRTPTAILRTEADVTLSRPHRTENEYRASVTIMSDASRRLTRIVDDLFLLARSDSGHLVMREEPLYLEELVDEATRAVRSVAEQRRVSVDVHELVDAPFRGDADLLGRLLLNLLDNAIKYSPEGGAVDVAMTRTAEQYTVTVTDSGPGIPADARDRVFERFFRADAARSRTDPSATSGAGLGLAIARRIADMHGGQLDLVDSEPGHTVFRVTLPAPARSAEHPARVAAEPPRV